MNRPITTVALLPTMTGTEIAAWCAEHKMTVTIDYMIDHEGFMQPLISARREFALGRLPMFLKKQAG